VRPSEALGFETYQRAAKTYSARGSCVDIR
jgi:hypothetical protein